MSQANILAQLGSKAGPTFRNRIINGAMVIDQRNAGASVSASGSFVVDRFFIYASQTSKFTAQQNAGSVTAPVGFTNYLGTTSSSAYSITATDQFLITQKIEGFNTADLNWGTANAKTVTLYFQVYSSLTGTFGGSLQNSAANRCYPFSYTVSSANTWTSVSVTIAGDTTGTWVGATNGVGIIVNFSLGTGSTYSGTAGSWSGSSFITSATGATSVVGTSGATFYITGVQLEVGSSATGFEYRQYQQELALCQRYYQQWDYTAALGSAGATAFTATKYSTVDTLVANAALIVSMRTAPTISSSNAGPRAVLSSGAGASLTYNNLSSPGNGMINLCAANNALSAGYGWIDQVGLLKASAEL